MRCGLYSVVWPAGTAANEAGGAGYNVEGREFRMFPIPRFAALIAVLYTYIYVLLSPSFVLVILRIIYQAF